VFTSDVKNRWGASWLQWRGYGPFFAEVIHVLERQRPPALALDVVPGPVHGATRSISIALEARDGEGRQRDLLHPAVVVRAGNAAPRDVVTHQVAPGRYEATLVADAREPLSVSTKGDEDGAARFVTRTIVPDAAAEYRFEPPDESLLQAIAAATGGAWRPAPAALRSAAGDRATERRAMWPPLLVLALGLWFADVLLRRIRVFE
jgi:hypothetical protein